MPTMPLTGTMPFRVFFRNCSFSRAALRRRGSDMCIRRIFSDKDISTMMNSFSAFLFPVPRSLFSRYERLSFYFPVEIRLFSSVSSFILLSRVFHFLLPSSSISQTRAAARSLCISVQLIRCFQIERQSRQRRMCHNPLKCRKPQRSSPIFSWRSLWLSNGFLLSFR